MKDLGLADGVPGWTVTVSGVNGRGIGGTPSPNGFQQVYEDRALFAQMDAVVIVLGTEVPPDGSYWVSRMQNLVKQLRGYNPLLRILWVAPGNYSSVEAKLEQRVGAILGVLPSLQTSTSPFSLIRWDLAAQQHPEWFTTADGKKFPRADLDGDGKPDGYVWLMDQIAAALTA
jgi:hypothetical protein